MGGFQSGNYCCYFESDCDGYYCFTRIGSPDSENSLNDCVSYVSVEPSMTRPEVTDIIPWNVEITRDLNWKTGHNLDAFNDLLRGGLQAQVLEG